MFSFKCLVNVFVIIFKIFLLELLDFFVIILNLLILTTFFKMNVTEIFLFYELNFNCNFCNTNFYLKLINARSFIKIHLTDFTLRVSTIVFKNHTFLAHLSRYKLFIQLVPSLLAK